MAAGQWDSPKQMYQATCAGCHAGSMPIAPELLGRKLAVEYVTFLVRHGKAGMPPFKETEYSDADVKALAQWIADEPAPAKAAGGTP
jgi:mono/diheme cytochrome c family protein